MKTNILDICCKGHFVAFSKPPDNLKMPGMHLSWYFYVQYILVGWFVLCSWPKPL